MDYFNWLCMIVMPDGEQRDNYAQLLGDLMDTEYIWVVDRDENRAEDGLELRQIFEDETGETCEQNGPCTLLEMLVALSIRVNNEIMYDPEDPQRADKIFWILVDEIISVSVFDSKMYDKNEVKKRLNSFLLRRWTKKTDTWLFLISKTSTNLDKIELWNLINRYLKRRFEDFFWGF